MWGRERLRKNENHDGRDNDKERQKRTAQQWPRIEGIAGHREGGRDKQNHDGKGHGTDAAQNVLNETDVKETKQLFPGSYQPFQRLGDRFVVEVSRPSSPGYPLALG